MYGSVCIFCHTEVGVANFYYVNGSALLQILLQVSLP